MTVKTREQAIQGRLDGMTRAGDKADRVDGSWKDEAIDMLVVFARERGDRPFLMEDFREWSGIESPADERAWGAVAQHARRLGIIQHDGFAPARSSNLSPKVRWRWTGQL